MGYVRRLATAGKVEISEKFEAEIETGYFLHRTKNQWVQDSIIYDNQSRPNTFKICSWLQQNIAKKGCKSVTIAGSTDKRMITATFSITLTGKFSPIQLICDGNTKKGIPAASFPSEFVVRANEKHDRNKRETWNMLENVFIPYIVKEYVSLNLDFDHRALQIMDVLKHQMTCAVRELLHESHILLKKAPESLTYLFQPLDVQRGPNGYVEHFMKKKLTLWYSDHVKRALDEGKDIKDVEISLQLSILKPLHPNWMIEMYNHMTSSERRADSLTLLSLMTMKDQNAKMKMEIFLMYSMKKVMMNQFKLWYDDKRCSYSLIRRERTCCEIFEMDSFAKICSREISKVWSFAKISSRCRKNQFP